ncbi:MAG: M23 family metallopeptidase [Rikenellaceae bacterium]
MKFSAWILIIYSTLFTDLYAQEKAVQYVAPLNIPLALSANFGELRSTHFHGGVDFKTKGVIGEPIVAVADGYVSRVSVSPSGYGNAIYINHPSQGVMVVCGHLSRYVPAVANFIKKNQYNNKTFKIDLYLKPNDFPVKQGEIIGYSGNSGSSGGPHLHFEMRSLASGLMLSPLKTCDITITDNIPPKIVSLRVVEIDRNYGIPIHIPSGKYTSISRGGGKYVLSQDTITINRDSYLAFEVTEVKSNSSNIFGVTSMRLLRGENEFWGYNIDHLSFDFGRAINGFKLYPESNHTRNDIIRTYVAPENKLSIYASKTNDGVIYKHELIAPQQFTLVSEDENGNKSTLSFVVKAGNSATDVMPMPQGELVNADKYYTHKDSVMEFSLSPYSLQQSSFLNVWSEQDIKFSMSHVAVIADNVAPFNKSAKLLIKVDNSNGVALSKLLIGQLSPSGRVSSAGGAYSSGYVSTSVGAPGRYVVVCDTIRPKISPLFSSKNGVQSSISFRISDDLSGIESYNGYIDDKWVLFEYDAKSAVIKHTMDPSVIKKGGRHNLSLEVSDAKGNISIYKTSLLW